MRRGARARVLLLGVLVGACGRAAADRTGNARTARVGMVDPVLSLDPRAARFVSEADVATQGFDGLVETTPSGEVIGTLAHRWEWLDEGRRLRVHLKQGTRWHDGRTLRADEVVASLRAALDDSTVATANDELVEMLAGKARDGEVPGGRRALLERIQAVDDSTLDLRIQPGDSTRIAAFGGTGWLVQRPGPAGSGPIGTGRWRPVRGVAGESTFVFSAFAQPWRSASALDTLVVRIIGASSLTAALIAGDIDCVPLVPARTRRELSVRSDVRLVEGEPTLLVLLALSPAQPRFADRRTRVALAHLFDRAAMAPALGIRRPVVSAGVELRFASGANAHPQWAFDPERARALLDSAGAAARDTLRVGYLGNLPDDSASGIAGAIGSALRSAGVPVRYVPSTDRYRDLVSGEIDLGTLTIIPGSDRPGELVGQFVPSSSDLLYRTAGRWVTRMDSLFARMQRAAPGDEATAALRAVDAAIARDQPVVPLWFYGRASASRSGGEGCDGTSASQRYLDIRPGVRPGR